MVLGKLHGTKEQELWSDLMRDYDQSLDGLSVPAGTHLEQAMQPLSLIKYMVPWCQQVETSSFMDTSFQFSFQKIYFFEREGGVWGRRMGERERERNLSRLQNVEPDTGLSLLTGAPSPDLEIRPEPKLRVGWPTSCATWMSLYGQFF